MAATSPSADSGEQVAPLFPYDGEGEARQGGGHVLFLSIAIS
ncbi:hypothetical protein OG787_29120 [Streptomyces sp. NBC_00075]